VARLAIVCAAAARWKWAVMPATMEARAACFQGLTLVHLQAQRKRFLWDKGCSGAVYRALMVGLEGVFRA